MRPTSSFVHIDNKLAETISNSRVLSWAFRIVLEVRHSLLV